VNPVIRDKVLDLCLNKGESADNLYKTALYEKDKVENGDWDEYSEDADHLNGKWEYEDVPMSPSDLGHLTDKDVLDKVYDSNSYSCYRIPPLDTVIQAVEEFSERQNSLDSFEQDLYSDAGKDVKIVHEGNEYFIDDGHNRIRVPPNTLQELCMGCKHAWRHEELRRRDG